MYLAVCVFLSLIFISLSISRFFITEKKYARFAYLFSLISGIAGFVLSGVIIAENYINISSSDVTVEIKEWAYDVFSGFLKDVLPVCLVVMALIIISSFLQPKMVIIRCASTSLLSIFVLVFGYLSSFLSENENISIKKEILLTSIFLSIMISVCEVVDFSRLYKELSKEKK